MLLTRINYCIFSVTLFLCPITAALAQDTSDTVQARAGALQTWREQCSDPNPDLRLAYVESAIASGEVPIQRICIRQALESDNADIRNLGLRAALASIPQLTFSTEMPKGLTAAYKAAADNEQKLRTISDSTTDRIYRNIRNGYVVVIEKASINKAQSDWFPLVANPTLDTRFSGKAVITGATVNWIGTIFIGGGGSRKCTMKVSTQTGGKLKGTLDCDEAEPFAISADLF